MDIEQIQKAANVIRAGGVVAYPTETFYGLAVDPMNPNALDCLLKLKGRDAAKGIPVIAGSLEIVSAHFAVPDCYRTALAELWPAPLTIALEPGNVVPESLSGTFDTVAVRVSALDTARQLASLSKGLITATSANLAGSQPVTKVEDLDPVVVDMVDCILDGGETPGGLPSTIIGLSDSGYRVFREGAYELSQLTAILEGLCQR